MCRLNARKAAGRKSSVLSRRSQGKSLAPLDRAGSIDEACATRNGFIHNSCADGVCNTDFPEDMFKVSHRTMCLSHESYNTHNVPYLLNQALIPKIMALNQLDFRQFTPACSFLGKRRVRAVEENGDFVRSVSRAA